jgi:peptidoglycan-associated lipoprotein
LDLGCAIFYSKRKGDSWTQAKEIKLKPEDADTLNCGHPAMDSAMKIMIFTSDFPGGYGMHDLWISEYDPREESWMKPVNLGPEINSTGDEMFPYLSENGDLYFSSDSYEGLGSLDIFKAKKLGENKWGNLENLGYPLNSFEDDYGIIFERNTDFEKGMFSSLRSPKDGQEGRPNIYNFKIPPLLIELMAEVTDSETGDPVPGATIKLTAIDTSGGIRNVFVETTDIDGIVHLKEISKGKRYIEHNLIYEVECQKDSFLVRKSKFSTFNLKPPGPKVEYVEFQVQPVSEKAIDFPEVQYALDKAELLVDTLDASLGQINSKDSLDFLYSTLIDNPTIVIELQAHTDCRGGDDYNQKLSQRRAQSCVDYLISKGIPAERMKAVGYGEAKPRMEGLECEAIADLSTSEEQEAAHQKNRRTQFIVLNFDYVPKDN